MNFSIILPIKGFSINAAYYATRKSKTAECRAWEKQVYNYIADNIYLKQMAGFKQFHVTMEFEYPEALYYNAKGDISSKTYDLSNVEKLLLDCLFTVIGANDKYVTELISRKRPGKAYAIFINILAIQS